MLSILFWIVAGLGALLAAVLILPVSVRVRAAAGPARVEVFARVLGGALPEFRMLDSRGGPRAGRETTARRRARTAGPAFRTRALRALPRLIGDLLGRFRIVELRAEGTFGLGDPADTGMVYGALVPFLYGGPAVSRLSLDVAPDFDRVCLEGRADATIRFRPAALLPPFVRFGWQAFGPGAR